MSSELMSQILTVPSAEADASMVELLFTCTSWIPPTVRHSKTKIQRWKL